MVPTRLRPRPIGIVSTKETVWRKQSGDNLSTMTMSMLTASSARGGACTPVLKLILRIVETGVGTTRLD